MECGCGKENASGAAHPELMDALMNMSYSCETEGQTVPDAVEDVFSIKAAAQSRR